MAAQSGIARFTTPAGEIINKACYFDDTDGAPVRWDMGNGAGAASPTLLTLNTPVALIDLILGAATTKTQTLILRPNQPPDYLLNALYLASVTTRPSLTVVYPAGYPIQFLQKA